MKYIGDKNVKAVINTKCLSYSIANTIGGKILNFLKRPNKGKKYNGNTFKDKDNRFKGLALLSKYFNR